MERLIFEAGLALLCFTASAAEPTVSVTAQQRYPWNGMVDVAFTITGESGAKYDTSFVARDVAGGTNLTMKTIYKSDGSSAALTNQLAAGSYKWVWNAAADLPDGFNCERVVLAMNIEKVYPSYIIVNLTTGEISSIETVPLTGWTNSYKSDFMVLRLCSPGTFVMQGSRLVTLTKPFYIGVFEVTVRQYCKFNNYVPGNQDDDLEFYWYQAAGCISYNTATTLFIEKLNLLTGRNFSLPTEAQWEFACRAGTSSLYNNGTSSIGSTADYGRAVDGIPGNVGRYQPNAWGIYDMHGNVRELVSDWYGELGSEAVTDPTGPSVGSTRVYRGGSFSDADTSCTSNSRGGVNPSWGSYYAPDFSPKDIEQQGFRICLTVE